MLKACSRNLKSNNRKVKSKKCGIKCMAINDANNTEVTKENNGSNSRVGQARKIAVLAFTIFQLRENFAKISITVMLHLILASLGDNNGSASQPSWRPSNKLEYGQPLERLDLSFAVITTRKTPGPLELECAQTTPHLAQGAHLGYRLISRTFRHQQKS
jgi:hypothetical protein